LGGGGKEQIRGMASMSGKREKRRSKRRGKRHCVSRAHNKEEGGVRWKEGHEKWVGKAVPWRDFHCGEPKDEIGHQTQVSFQGRKQS